MTFVCLIFKIYQRNKWKFKHLSLRKFKWRKSVRSYCSKTSQNFAWEDSVHGYLRYYPSEYVKRKSSQDKYVNLKDITIYEN